MARQRFIFCGIAAAFILSGGTHAQEVSGLRASLEAPDRLADARDPADGSVPVAIATRPTTLEVNPLVEPPRPPLPRRRHEAEPYAALGLDVGGLTVFPVLRAGVIASGNPASASSNRKGDIGARPSLLITSDWIRHELTLEGAGDFIAYADEDDYDSNNANIRARGCVSMCCVRPRSLSVPAIR